MAHHNNQSRTPRSLHRLQDDRLFSLSGGIPPEHFDDLNFVSMRRGRRLAAPAPTGDPWGYYAERRESRHIEADRTWKPLHNLVQNRLRKPWIQMKDKELQPDF